MQRINKTIGNIRDLDKRQKLPISWLEPVLL